MKITATNLASIQDGSYYLSNKTGEIAKAGLWQWLKCATGWGDGRAKVQRLVEAIKTSLLADAAIQADDELSNNLDALDKTKSLSSSDLKRIATRFKTTHADAVAKSDAFRLADSVVDDVVARWVKNRAIHPDSDSVGYMRKLALYSARAVIDKAREYGDDDAKLAEAIKSKMNLMQQLLGAVECMVFGSNLRYPQTQKVKVPGSDKVRYLTAERFILDELHFRAILSVMFEKDGNINMLNFGPRLLQLNEDEVLRRKDYLLGIQLDGPDKPGCVQRFAAEAAKFKPAEN